MLQRGSLGDVGRERPALIRLSSQSTIAFGKDEKLLSNGSATMNRLQLATLLSWAGDSGLQGRKRLQKVVFFLQQAGCPLDCHYSLHHFGPYSRDVADICDEMVAAGLVNESAGGQYEYKLTPQTVALLDRCRDPEMTKFKVHGEQLIKEKPWSLELGSTILFYFSQNGGDWDDATRKACDFKKVPVANERNLDALALAKKFGVSTANN